MRTLLVLSLFCLASAASAADETTNGFVLLNPERSQSQTQGTALATSAGDDRQASAVPSAGSNTDAACRTQRTVEAGVAMGGVSGHYAGARVDYGRDDGALRAGMPNPCPSTGFAMSVAVSQADTEIRSGHGNRLPGPPPLSPSPVTIKTSGR